MKFILQNIRYGINKVFYKQRAIVPTAKRHDITRARHELDFDMNVEYNRIYVTQILYNSPSLGLNALNMRPPTKNAFAFETRGLLDLVGKEEIAIQKPSGDFSSMNPDNFVHALNLSKVEIEYATDFKLDEIQTTVSQMVDNVSILEESGNFFDSQYNDSIRNSANTTSSHEEAIPVAEAARDRLLNNSWEVVFRPML